MGNERGGRRSFLAAMVIITAQYVTGCSGEGSSKVDPTDYKAVAYDFLQKNALIGRKIGKVTRIDHFGVGGGNGQISYNVFRITGTMISGGSQDRFSSQIANQTETVTNAVCHVTLKRDDKMHWTVQQAIMSVEGQDYKLPVQRYNIVRSLKIW